MSNTELMTLFGQPQGPQAFDQIRISIALPERILSCSWSLNVVFEDGV